jgi:hypothetical protein
MLDTHSSSVERGRHCDAECWSPAVSGLDTPQGLDTRPWSVVLGACVAASVAVDPGSADPFAERHPVRLRW